MNTFLAILKVTDARRDVILAGGLYHIFPWRHLPPLSLTVKTDDVTNCARDADPHGRLQAVPEVNGIKKVCSNLML